MIQATNLTDKVWEIQWGLSEFSSHIDEEGNFKSIEWSKYFELLCNALRNKNFTSAEISGRTSLILNLVYPLEGATIRGTLAL